MKFERKFYGGFNVYCKDDYHKEYDNDGWYNINNHQWYYKGYLIHREDGPAIEYSYNVEEWYLNGIEYSEKKYWEIINAMNRINNKKRVLNDI